MVYPAGAADLPALTNLALQLWPDHEALSMQQDLEMLMSRKDVAFFLATDRQMPIGFAQCQLRQDYVEGTESSPVGYLEGIFVADGYRKRGIARALLSACECWTKAQGCTEFASDCELSNRESLKFHLNMGFEEANRIICFTKKL